MSRRTGEEESVGYSPEIIDHYIDRSPSRLDYGSTVDMLSELIRQDLNMMRSTQNLSEIIKNAMDCLLGQIDEARGTFYELRSRTSLRRVRDLQQLRKRVSRLKSAYPSDALYRIFPEEGHARLNEVPSLSDPDENISVSELRNGSRICLICFLVFPEKAIIKKSLLACWAKAHGIVALDDPVDDLLGNGLIQPLYKDTSTVAGYTMDPCIRSNLLNNQSCLQVSDFKDLAYVAAEEEGSFVYQDIVRFSATKGLRFLHLGIWQRSPTSYIEVEDQHFFFKYMAELSKLRFFSLRGISLVTELPRFITSLENLEILDLKGCRNLQGLPSDIGNLQSSLTHLDISECYFLEHMPMALSRLVNLQVLKGFVIGEAKKRNSCTLRNLLSLVNLRKLNIYSRVKSFPDDKQLATLKEIKSLRSLTISWGGCLVSKRFGDCDDEDSTATNMRKHPAIGRHGQDEAQQAKTSGGILRRILRRRDSTVVNNKVSFNLEKLDLHCVPETVTRWLKPANFKHLKNLYITGGQFCDLAQQGEDRAEEFQWNVEILRLKHLDMLEMDYAELADLFPKLICLEYVQCSNLKNFPPDRTVVRKDTSQPPPTTFL